MIPNFGKQQYWILPRFWIFKLVIVFVVILAEETSLSNPSAMSQSCNLFFSSMLMIYNLASTTMLPRLKMEKYRNCYGWSYFSIKQKICLITSWYQPLESWVWKLDIYLQSVVKNCSNYLTVGFAFILLSLVLNS